MVNELLQKGRENARSASELCAALNINNRKLRQLVEHERRQGHAICTDISGSGGGYFLAADKDEMEAYCRRLWKTINSLAKTCRACQKVIDTLPPGSEED